MNRGAAISLISLWALAAPAAAQPPDDDSDRPTVEWSTWIRLAYGAAQHPQADLVLRTVSPAVEPEPRWEAAAGADASLPLGSHGDVRLGVWAEARTSSAPVVGGELLIGAAPAKLDMFFHRGEGLLIVRGGGNREVMTGAIAYGYRCAWKLFGPWRGRTRYMIGVRVVAAATRAVADPDDWTMTVGVEAEPVGSLRYLLGIRGWY